MPTVMGVEDNKPSDERQEMHTDECDHPPRRQRGHQGLAELIEEIEQFYGSTDIQPFEERQAQVEDALFGSPPLASALVGEDETGDIVGLAAYSFLWPSAGSTHSLFLKELYVLDALRRQGIGQRLMSELHALAAARPGCSRVEWMTDRDNPSARAFYRSLGFAEREEKIVYRSMI